jgi:predicted AAA+ superfamily ATPase
LREDVARWSAYIRDSILEPAIGRDILALAAVRRPALLRQVFGVGASSPAQIVSLQKIQGQLQDAGALETIAHYLALLEEAFLLAPVPKYSTRAARRRASPPKLVTLNNALVAVMDPHGVAQGDADAARFGTWVENACLAHAWNSGQDVAYWREEPLEVDGILQGSWGKWAIEVKTGRFQMNDLAGLLEFTRRHSGFKPLVICSANGRAAAERAEGNRRRRLILSRRRCTSDVRHAAQQRLPATRAELLPDGTRQFGESRAAHRMKARPLSPGAASRITAGESPSPG